jgi:hypothetical protein
MFNIMNNTNLTAQMQFLFDGNGRIIPAALGPAAPTASASRQIQLGLRLLF